MGLRPVPPRKGPYEGKTVVFGMVERGGRARTLKVPDATGQTLQPILLKEIDLERSRLMTDGSPTYRRIKDYLPHEAIDHEVEYLRGDVHKNTDGYWSNLKRRSIWGVPPRQRRPTADVPREVRLPVQSLEGFGRRPVRLPDVSDDWGASLVLPDDSSDLEPVPLGALTRAPTASSKDSGSR